MPATLTKIPGTVHSSPAMAAASKYGAGAWGRTHAPPRLLAWLKRFHTWPLG